MIVDSYRIALVAEHIVKHVAYNISDDKTEQTLYLLFPFDIFAHNLHHPSAK